MFGRAFAEDGRQHLVGIEIRLGQRTGGARVPIVVSGDGLGAGYGVVERAKWNEALADGIVSAESGVLHEAGLPGGQVLDGSIADPPAHRLHVHVLSH